MLTISLFTQITSFSNFFSGDPYIGDARAEIKRKNERIAELEKEVKRLRSEVDRNSFSRSRDHARPESGEDKKKRSEWFSQLFHFIKLDVAWKARKPILGFIRLNEQ